MPYPMGLYRLLSEVQALAPLLLAFAPRLLAEGLLRVVLVQDLAAALAAPLV